MAEDEPKTESMDSPVYRVLTPNNMPDMLFPGEEYEGAYEWATGESIDSGKDDNDGEGAISIVDFGGPVDVPVSTAY